MREVRPISAALEEEVLREVRRHGIVVWLDRDGAYTRLVDELLRRHREGSFPVPVVAFRGSFLEMLLELEPHGHGLDSTPLLIHMPGFNEESIRPTPLLELYEAGRRFRRALETLVREVARGRVEPDELERFASSPGLTLEGADQWLASQLSTAREGLAGLLEQTSLEVVVGELLGKDTFLASRVRSEAEVQVLAAWLYRHTGMDEAWVRFYGNDPQGKSYNNLAVALGAWLLCVEYVNDLARQPHLEVLRRLKGLTTLETCTHLVQQLRERYPERYAALADEVELHLPGELSGVSAEDLGKIDTFRTEEVRLLEAAMGALRGGEWARAREWAAARAGESSFWLARDQARRFAWTLVGEAAALGEALAAHRQPLQGARSLEEAVERYTQGACEVDRLHRRFEQQRLALLEPRLPHFGDLQEVVGVLRRRYREWADALAREFTTLCKQRGFLPEPEWQQRTLYDQVVHPLLQEQERVVLFLVDAFRYEMALELSEELKGAGAQVDLKARLAELPTLTAVGMNVLAPVAQGGRLWLAGKEGFGGFKTGEYTVRRPEDRARAMGSRCLGHTARSFTLSEVCEADTAQLKRMLGTDRLVIIHSKEIDDAGEANVGLATFSQTLRQLRDAWRHLQAAGVKRFVFTADHGFLLQDETTEVRPYGTRRDPSRRHVVEEQARAEVGLVSVSLSALGYVGPGGEPVGGYLLLREDTAVFATGVQGATFVHGGNSLQERVIPLLTVGVRRRPTLGLAAYTLEARQEGDVLGMRRLALRALWSREAGLLPLGTPEPLEVALRVPGREDIEVTIKDAPGVEVRSGRLRVPIREQWTEVFFSLEGKADEQVRVEVLHPDPAARVAPCLVEGWFSVVGTRSSKPEPGTPPPAGPSWQEAFADEGVRKVFAHLEKHGAMTEAEITQALGSPRAFRRFSLEFEGYMRKVPFRVRIEAAATGKRYVKEGESL